jgi:amino acid transporter
VVDMMFGRRLRTDQEIHERLDNPTALAVFASDALSSVAYATEEMLTVLLIGGAGLLAFGTLVPLTLGIVALLVILVFSYRQTIKAYPSAGGAYIVTRDNFGVLPAQIAGVALLTDYILTVAVSTSAGVAAMYSAFPAAYPYRVAIAVALIWIIAWMNLRGVKESGRIFAVPTYGFVISIIVLIAVGVVKAIVGGLDPIHVQHAEVAAGAGGSLGIFLLMKAYAGGSTAMTGVEAISNGVPAFRPVEW